MPKGATLRRALLQEKILLSSTYSTRSSLKVRQPETMVDSID